jgi:hypothetical protein
MYGREYERWIDNAAGITAGTADNPVPASGYQATFLGPHFSVVSNHGDLCTTE